MTNKKFSHLFGQPARNSKKDLLTQFHMDIAASIQVVTEEIVLKLTSSIAKEYKIQNLCLAGGVALNCVANGKILKNNIFKNIWIQPAAGDAGGSLGAALALWHIEQNNPRKVDHNDSMQGSYLGPSFSNDHIKNELNLLKANFIHLSEDELIKEVTK